MNAPRTTGRRNERGVVIIWTAFFMLMMLGFVAIGVDVAKVMATRTELQNAADAAALAGVSALDLVTGKVKPDSAVVRAQQTALRNEAFVDSPKPITLLPGDVLVDPDENTVKVTVRRDAATDGAMITHIAQVLGIKNVDVSATATAKAEHECSQCEKLVPLGAFPPNGATAFNVGCAFTYTLLEGQGDAVSANYQALSLPECDEGPCGQTGAPGASTLSCLLAGGYSCCVGVGDIVLTKPGVNSGPVRTGLQGRWDADSNHDIDICYSDYLARGGNGMRVIDVPVVQWTSPNGRTQVRVVGFAAFFLKRRPTGGGQPVYAEFVYDVAPGNGGNCNSTVFTIRLTQ
jgi:Flp pilus assembly protein TadG